LEQLYTALRTALYLIYLPLHHTSTLFLPSFISKVPSRLRRLRMGMQKDQDSRSLTAEYYCRHRQQLAEKGTIKKYYAIFIKNNIKGIKNSRKSKFSFGKITRLWAPFRLLIAFIDLKTKFNVRAGVQKSTPKINIF
jgi:hypothetical protein